MVTGYSSTNSDRTCARATVFAFRAALLKEGREEIHRFTLEGEQRLASPEATIETLSAFSKPVQCAARIREDSVMAISCRKLAEREAAHLLENAEHPGISEFLRTQFGGDETVKVLLEGVDESMVMSVADVEQWRREYSLAGLGISVGLARPDGGASGLAGLVGAVLRFSAASRYPKWYYEPD